MDSDEQQIFNAKQKIKTILSADKDTSKGQIKEIILPVLENEAKKLSYTIGLDITVEYKHTIDKSGINHAFKKHGEKQENERGQKQLTNEDFLKIPEIIKNYDNVCRPLNKNGKFAKNMYQNDLILYTKTFKNGTTYYVEEIRTGQKELAFSTMWIRKKESLFSDSL